jgi:hypothetical protein
MTSKVKLTLADYRAPQPDSVYARDKVFKVQLYWGHVKEFTNKKHVVNYLAAASRFMNDRFNELNYLVADVYNAYRMSWPYIKSAALSNKIDQQFLNIGNHMNKWCNNFGLAKNYNAFERMYRSCDLITIILKELLKIEKGRYNAAPALISVLEIRLQNCRKLVDEFLATP